MSRCYWQRNTLPGKLLGFGGRRVSQVPLNLKNASELLILLKKIFQDLNGMSSKNTRVKLWSKYTRCSYASNGHARRVVYIYVRESLMSLKLKKKYLKRKLLIVSVIDCYLNCDMFL